MAHGKLSQTVFEVLLRQGEEEAEQVERQYRQAKTRSEQEYEEAAAAAMAAKKELSADEQGELRGLGEAELRRQVRSQVQLGNEGS